MLMDNFTRPIFTKMIFLLFLIVISLKRMAINLNINQEASTGQGMQKHYNLPTRRFFQTKCRSTSLLRKLMIIVERQFYQSNIHDADIFLSFLNEFVCLRMPINLKSPGIFRNQSWNNCDGI